MKKATAVLMTMMLLLFFAACTPSSETPADTVQTVDSAEIIYGKIKEINGNEIVLAVGTWSTGGFGGQMPVDGEDANRSEPEDMEGMPEESPDGNRSFDAQDESAGRPDVEFGSNPDGERGGPAGMQMPAEGMPEGGLSSGADRSGGSGMQGGAMGGSLTLTGEEAIFLIPVTAMVTTGQGDNAREVRFTQLAVKNVVRLHLDEAGTVVHAEVLQ